MLIILIKSTIMELKLYASFYFLIVLKKVVNPLSTKYQKKIRNTATYRKAILIVFTLSFIRKIYQSILKAYKLKYFNIFISIKYAGLLTFRKSQCQTLFAFKKMDAQTSKWKLFALIWKVLQYIQPAVYKDTFFFKLTMYTLIYTHTATYPHKHDPHTPIYLFIIQFSFLLAILLAYISYCNLP